MFLVVYRSLSANVDGQYMQSKANQDMKTERLGQVAEWLAVRVALRYCPFPPSVPGRALRWTKDSVRMRGDLQYSQLALRLVRDRELLLLLCEWSTVNSRVIKLRYVQTIVTSSLADPKIGAPALKYVNSIIQVSLLSANTTQTNLIFVFVSVSLRGGHRRLFHLLYGQQTSREQMEIQECCHLLWRAERIHDRRSGDLRHSRRPVARAHLVLPDEALRDSHRRTLGRVLDPGPGSLSYYYVWACVYATEPFVHHHSQHVSADRFILLCRERNVDTLLKLRIWEPG